jgi:hypothetical protein
MKTKDLLKRIYYALMSGALLVALVSLLGIIDRDGNFYLIHPLRFPMIVTIVALAFCWIMTQHNKRHRAILLSVIILTSVLALIYSTGLFYLAYSASDGGYLLSSWGVGSAWSCAACMMIAGFLSETKYHNILPNQRKGISTLFRTVSWIGQIALWGYGVAILLTALGVIK